MYQVLAGMQFSFSVMLFFGSIGYNRNNLQYVIVCKMQAFLTAYFLWVAVGKTHEFDVSLALFVCAHEEFQEAGNILCGFLNLVSPWILGSCSISSVVLGAG